MTTEGIKMERKERRKDSKEGYDNAQNYKCQKH
jgi:hypothetical protein